MSTEHHPDFPKSNSTDIVLQGQDGILFHVARAELMRASTVFSDLFEIGHAEISGTLCFFQSQETLVFPRAHINRSKDTPVSVSESSLQLEILFKLIALRSAPLEKLTTLSSAANLWTIAAEKYLMPGVAQVLMLVIRGLLPKESDPVTRYIYAKSCGLEDLASNAMDDCCKIPPIADLPGLPEAHVRHILAITLERDRRVRHFSFRLRARGGPKGDPKPLVDGFCACDPAGDQHPVATEVSNRFREFALDVGAQYTSTPSVITTLEKKLLQKELQRISELRCQSSGARAYPVHRVREWLLRVEGSD